MINIILLSFYNLMAEQDWKPVVIVNKKVQQEEAILNGKTETIQKFDAGKNKQNENKNMLKIEEKVEEGDLHTASISKNLRMTIQQERNKKKWTRKDLALKCNLPESIIADYENGKGVPNQQHINKISRALGVPLSNKH
jgi:putative transcription factor